MANEQILFQYQVKTKSQYGTRFYYFYADTDIENYLNNKKIKYVRYAKDTALNKKEKRIKELFKENKQLKEDLKVYDKIFDTFSKRKYAHKYLEERRKEIPNLLAPDSDEIYEKYYQLKEENENLRETIKNDDLTINKLCKENKILRENAEHNDKVVDDYWWENKHYKYIINELEKWSRERKEYYKSLHSQRVYAFNDTLIKIQQLKGSDYEKGEFN